MTREERIDAALAAYLAAVDAGKPPAREEFLAGFPELADELGDALDAMEAVDALAGPSPETHVSVAPLRDARPTLELGENVRYFGDYELVEEVARGGMGVVFRARQVSLNRPVALKMILDGALASDEAVRRFRREAESAARLDHENIVDIYEVGEHDGHHFFSMPFLKGGSLATDVATRVGDERGAAVLLERVARAVDHGHRRGVIHRDLKPANILLDEGGVPHVCDFGLARAVDEPGDLTATGAVLGTPAYMAPEQAAGRGAVSVSTDVWSLGAILHELLAGKPPFTGATPLEVLRRVLETRPAPLAATRDMRTIVAKCLERDPERRYLTAAALADDLAAFLAGRPLAARPVGPLEGTLKWARRRPAVAGLVGVSILALVVLLVGGAVFLRRERGLHAETQRNLNRARALGLAAASYERELAGESDAALILAREAVLYEPEPRTVQRLREALDAPPDPRVVLASRDSAFGSFALHPAGDALLAYEASWVHGDHAPRLYDLDGRLLRTFVGHEERVYFARFSGDGRHLVTASGDGSVRLWNLSGQGCTVLRGEFTSAGAALAPDGETLVTAFSGSNTAELWSSSGEKIGLLYSDDAVDFATLEYSADSSSILGLSRNRRVELWDVRGTNRASFQLDEPGEDDEQFPLVARFVSNDERILTYAPGAGLELWTLEGGKILELEGHAGQLHGVELSPDGRRVLTASADGTARLFDLTGAQHVVLEHESEVLCASFAPSGQRIVTGCEDGSCAIWTQDGRLVETWPAGEGGIRRARFTRDERLVVTASEHETELRLWERRVTGTLVHRPPAGISSGRFTKDGDVLVTCEDGSLHRVNPGGEETLLVAPQMSSTTLSAFLRDDPVLVSAAAGGPVRLYPRGPFWPVLLQGHTGQALAADLSRDGALVATGSRDGTARTWSMAGEAGVVLEHGAEVRAVAVSPDGERLLTVAGERELSLWTLAGSSRVLLDAHTGRIVSARFSPDGTRVISAAVDGTARVWALDGSEVAVLRGHEHGLTGAVVAPDRSRFATGTVTGVVRVFAADGSLEREVRGAPQPVRELRFSPDGAWFAFVCAGASAEVRQVHGSAGHSIPAADDPVRFLRFSAAGDLVAWTRGGEATRLRPSYDGEWVVEEEGSAGFAPVTIALSPDGRRALAAGEHVARRAMFDLAGDLATERYSTGIPIATPDFLDDARIRVVAREVPGSVVVYDSAGKLLWRFQAAGALAMSTDERRWVCMTLEGSARLVSSSGEHLADLDLGADDTYASVARFLPDGSGVFVGDGNGKLILFDPSGQRLVSFDGHTSPVDAIDLSPDGGRLLSRETAGTARLWTVAGEELAVLGEKRRADVSSFRESESVYVARFSPDGARILTGSSEGTVTLHDEAGVPLFEVRRHRAPVHRVAFSPDGARFVSADHEGNVFLWNADGSEVAALAPHDGWIVALAFSPDGTRVLSAGHDDTLRVSCVATEDLLQRADERLHRDFDALEVTAYGDLLSDETKERAAANE